MILIIDNYDSFTYNLVQAFESLGSETLVVKNDQITLESINELNPDGIVISPGPCTPNEAGICLQVVRDFHKTTPIFGVCLGHQVIASAFDSKVVRADQVLHGKVDDILHTQHHFFNGVPEKFKATRYHSLVIEKNTLSDQLEVLATSNRDQVIMAVKHRDYEVYGVQFHPESCATPDGMKLIESFIKITLEQGGQS